ncbi:MAG: class I SAM-dependent methyltransferase [Phototrophicaceae bacterium]
MNQETIARLNAINANFYDVTATEFDATRVRAWAGWEPLTDVLSAPLSVLDVGCGNGRFGIFLANHLEGAIAYHGLDNNVALLNFAETALADYPQLKVTMSQHDVITSPLPNTQADLVVLFGVLHHVPGYDNRQQFMRALADRVASGGLLVVAAWRFYEYERFKARLVDWDNSFTVEKHDYLLDWRRGDRALRYCHYVDDDELAELIAASGLREVKRYRADGSDNRMNVYVVLQKD